MRQILETPSGKLSSSRLLSVLASVSFLVVWIIISIKKFTLAPIPDGFISVYGILTGSGLAQKYFVEAGNSISVKPKGE